MYYLNSLIFALLATTSAAVVAMIFYLLRSSTTRDIISNQTGNKLRSGLDIITNVAEGVPVLILLIILGQGTKIGEANHWQEYLIRGLILGLFLFTSMWRYLDTSLDAAVKDLYPKQLLMLRIPPLRVGLYYVLWRRYMKGFWGSVIWIFSWSIIIDASMGYLSSGVLSKSYVNWFDESIGVVIGKKIGRGEWDASVTMNILLLVAFCISLFVISNILTRSKKTRYNKNRYAGDSHYITINSVNLNAGVFELSGTDIDLESNEFCLLAGPSGSGKSVFIKSLLEFLPVDEGNIQAKLSIAKRDDINELHHSLSVMFQEPDLYLYPYLTVGDLMSALEAKPEKNYYLSNSIIETIKGRKDTMISSLSAGEKRKLALFIAVAKTTSPENPVLVFDEPDSSLDDNSVRDLAKSIAEIHNKPVIYITHNLNHGLDIIKTMSEKTKRKLSLLQITKRNTGRAYDQRHDIDKVRAPEDILQGKIKAAEQILGNVRKCAAEPESRSVLKIVFPITLRVDNGIKIKAFKAGLQVETLKIAQGSGIVGIVGENGIGKSTLLRAIMGLIGFEGGEIHLGNDTRSNRISTEKVIHKHGITYVYDDIEKALPDKLPLNQIISILCRVHRRPLSALKYYNKLDDSQKRQCINDFSGGQRQLIVFDIVCHLIDAKLILMDEPFSRLDWNENLALVLQWLIEKANNCPIMIISHNREILEAVANTIYEIRR